ARRNIVPDRAALRRLSRSNSQGQWHGQKPSPPSRYNAVNSQTVAVPFFRARRHDDPRLMDTAICSPALIRVPLVTNSFAAPLENIFPAYALGLTTFGLLPIVAAVAIMSPRIQRDFRAPNACLVAATLLFLSYQLQVPSFAQEAKKIRMAYSALSVA